MCNLQLDIKIRTKFSSLRQRGEKEGQGEVKPSFDSTDPLPCVAVQTGTIVKVFACFPDGGGGGGALPEGDARTLPAPRLQPGSAPKLKHQDGSPEI